jgi:hypothetical protein
VYVSGILALMKITMCCMSVMPPHKPAMY